MNKLIWHGRRIQTRIESEATSLTQCLAKTTAKIAKRLVPVKTGALRETISANENIVSAGSEEVDYADKVELGTATRAARPFLRPANEQLNKTDVDNCLR